MNGPVTALLPDGRLHLQHGPIDLVVAAISERLPSPLRGGTAEAYRTAANRFATILDELCAELPLLRQPACPGSSPLRGTVARRMWSAVAPHAANHVITPMAAVAGAVAEEVLAAMMAVAPLSRASVNNGGDIALHLAPGESVRVGLVDRPDRPGLFGTTTIGAADPVRGIATSGWRGRSFSLGIADAVTVLARTAAEADAAATVIANAIDLPGHPAVLRVSAREVQHDSDLGERLVTRHVGALTAGEIDEALERGRAVAEDLVRRGLIVGAALHMQGETVTTASRAGLRREAFSPCGRRWPSRRRGSDEGCTAAVGDHSSSVAASPRHLLPQGEKDVRVRSRVAA